jgi:hypothetical protein
VVSGLELPLTGEYSILVRSFAAEGGNYSLSLDEGSDSTTNFYDAGDLIFGQTAQETLRENEAHTWFFSGRAGDEIFITANPLTDKLDLDIWLLDENVNRLAEQDALLTGEPEMIEFVLPNDGQYLILVRDFFGESGRYEISLRANQVAAPDEVGTISYGETQSGTLQVGQTVVWYFEAEEGDILDIELSPEDSNADLLFIVYDPAGNQIWSIDAAEAGGMEQVIDYPIMSEGRWSIVVKEFFGEAASYILTVDGD